MSDRPSPAQPVPRSSRAVDAVGLYLALLGILLTVIALYVLVQLRFLLIILFFALLLASGIAGPVRRLERRGVPRSAAILLVYAVIFGTFGVLSWYVLPRLLGQAAGIAEDLPRRLEEARRLQERIDELSAEYPILRDLDTRLVALAERGGERITAWVLALPGAIARTLFALASIFTIAFLMLMTKERLLTVVLSLVHPRHRAATQRVLQEMAERIGAYLRAKVIVMVIVGALVWATLTALGSPYPILIAIFAGAMEALPKIGPWIGRAAILVTVLPQGWEIAAAAMVAHVVIENLKGYVISPLVESDQVNIHPLTAFVAIIAGGLLLGWIGALIAVPVAAALQVLVEDVLIPWRRARLAAAELEYMVGPPAPATEDGAAAASVGGGAAIQVAAGMPGGAAGDAGMNPRAQPTKAAQRTPVEARAGCHAKDVDSV